MDNEIAARTCRDCGETKNAAEFSSAGRHRRNHCRPCSAVRARRWRHADPDRAFGQHLQRRYGVTLADYQAMFAAQDGRCAICGAPPAPADKPSFDVVERLCVDHCHASGKIRGLLCSPCNKGIGQLGDSPERLRHAAAYLERVGSH